MTAPCAYPAPCSPASSRPTDRDFEGGPEAPAASLGYDAVAGRRAVLTGGACQLTGTRELAARILNKQVRMGRPQAFPGLAAASAGPDYATAIGLLMAGASVCRQNSESGKGRLAGGRQGQKLALQVDRPVTGVIQQYNERISWAVLVCTR